MGELLQGPAIAVGIADVDKMPPILYIDLADVSASFEPFLATGSRVLNHHLQPFLRSRLHVCNPNPNGDRTGGALRSQLNKAEVLIHLLVKISVKAKLFGIKGFGTVNVGN